MSRNSRFVAASARLLWHRLEDISGSRCWCHRMLSLRRTALNSVKIAFSIFRATNWYKIAFLRFSGTFIRFFRLLTLLEDVTRGRLCMRAFYWYGARRPYEGAAYAWIMESVSPKVFATRCVTRASVGRS